MQPIARCGYHDYTVIDRVFSIVRPQGAGSPFGGAEAVSEERKRGPG